jgi:ABC-2 type transport system ATP-binding protein
MKMFISKYRLSDYRLNDIE